MTLSNLQLSSRAFYCRLAVVCYYRFEEKDHYNSLVKPGTFLILLEDFWKKNHTFTIFEAFVLCVCVWVGGWVGVCVRACAGVCVCAFVCVVLFALLRSRLLFLTHLPCFHDGFTVRSAIVQRSGLILL